jgi:hypothetical protein
MTDHDPDYRKPTWDELSQQRWGPSLRHAEPGIDVPPDWRWRVANLPCDRWLAWRRRSNQIQATLGHPPTVDEIRAADRMAAEEILAAEDATGDAPRRGPVRNTGENSEGESTETEVSRE